MDGWVLIGAAVISAAAAIIGSVSSQHMQVRGAAEQAKREASRRAWEARRDAYVNLLRLLDRVEAISNGAVGRRSHAQPDYTGLDADLVSSAAMAEFHAPTGTWERMKPWYSAVSAKANFMALPRGATTVEGMLKLRENFLAAAREDLELSKPER